MNTQSAPRRIRGSPFGKAAVYTLLGMILFPRSSSAQVFTENAGVTSPATPTLRESLSIEEAENLFDFRLNHELLWGINPKTELRITVPTVLYRRISFEHARRSSIRFSGGTGRRSPMSLSEDSAGLGDVSLRLKHSLHQRDEIMSSTRWAVLGELTAPTGDHHDRDSGIAIPRRLQLGSGSMIYGVGTAFTLIRNRHRFSADLVYRHRSRHDGFRPGPTLDWNLAYWYRFTPARFDSERESTEVRGVIELLNSYRFDSRIGSGGAGDHGLLTWVAPGIQVYPRRDILIEAAVQIPIIQTIDDDLGDRRWRAVVAVKFLF